MALNDELHEHAKQAHSSIKKYALEYGENREGYWTRYKFMVQIKQAVNIAEIKYSGQLRQANTYKLYTH